MSKQYKHLFFDLDHTLWDFDENSRKTLQQLFIDFHLEERGIKEFNKFYESYLVHNDKLWERFRNGYIKREELRWKRLWLTFLDFKIADTHLANDMSAAYLEILPTQTVLIPGAKELLDYCSTKYHLHLITNGFESTQLQKLQFSGISSYFQQVITSEKSERPKPHKEIYDYALSATGAMAEQSIMIGDALEIDILGAENAGWDQVYFNPQKIAHKSRPTFEIQSLKELLSIF